MKSLLWALSINSALAMAKPHLSIAIGLHAKGQNSKMTLLTSYEQSAGIKSLDSHANGLDVSILASRVKAP